MVGGERVSEGVGVLGSDAQGGRVGCCPVKLSCVCFERVVRGEREGSIGMVVVVGRLAGREACRREACRGEACIDGENREESISPQEGGGCAAPIA